MSSSAFHSPETGGLRSVQAFPLQFVSVREPSELPFPQANLQEKDWREDGPGCIRGVRFALAIEAAAALMIYGAWQFLHLLR